MKYVFNWQPFLVTAAALVTDTAIQKNKFG